VTLAYDSLGRKVSETQANRTRYGFTYNPATLAPATETLAHDLNADGTPDFTRVLDRSRDTLAVRPGGCREIELFPDLRRQRDRQRDRQRVPRVEAGKFSRALGVRGLHDSIKESVAFWRLRAATLGAAAGRWA